MRNVVIEARQAKLDILNRQKKREEVIKDTNFSDSNDAAVWQAVFEKDAKMFWLIEEKRHQQAAKKALNNLSVALKECTTKSQRNASYRLTTMLASAFLSNGYCEYKPLAVKKLYPIWRDAGKKHRRWLKELKEEIEICMDRRSSIVEDKKRAAEWNKPYLILLKLINADLNK